MIAAEQLGWGLVLALTVWEAMPSHAYARLLLSAAAGILAGLSLVLEGHVLGGVVLGIGTGIALPWLVQERVPPGASLAEWLVGAPLVALGLLITPLDTAFAIMAVGLVRLIAHPAQAALPLGTMQVGIALAVARQPEPDPILMAAACLPLVALMLGAAQLREAPP